MIGLGPLPQARATYIELCASVYGGRLSPTSGSAASRSSYCPTRSPSRPADSAASDERLPRRSPARGGKASLQRLRLSPRRHAARSACSPTRATPTRAPRPRRAAAAPAQRRLRKSCPAAERLAWSAAGHGARHVRVPRGARTATCASRSARGDARRSIRGAILENWKQLDAALHPQGAKGERSLLGATASDVFLLSKGQLERDGAGRPGHRDVAVRRATTWRRAIDKRVLAVLGVPLAQRAEADRGHAARAPARVRRRLVTAGARGRRASASRRSTASRSPATRAPARSPTRRFARC